MIKAIILTLILIIILSSNCFAQDPDPRFVDSYDHTVFMNAKVTSGSNPKIVVNWENNELDISYSLFKKEIDSQDWLYIGEFDTNVLSYEDSDIIAGKAYEYAVRSFAYASLRFNGSKGDSIAAVYFSGFGYILAGIEIEPIDNYGSVLLLIDETQYDKIKDEINTYQNDLISEGWGVYIELMPRTQQFNSERVNETKAIIKKYRDNKAINLSSVLIVGRVAIPYAGEYPPDRHPDHFGAWPADIWYSNFDNSWTDSFVNNVSGTWVENHNVPGDGKFDQGFTKFGEYELSIGRIDFTYMTVFPYTETELIKRYFHKNHKYRSGEFEYEYKGIVDDNFPAYYYQEGYASSGWRNIASILGSENTVKGDWLTTLTSESYLWAYGCGSGWFSHADGIVTSKDFADRGTNAVFTMLFGSYFGDWHFTDNLLRAAIASDPMALTAIWSGRPHWYLHHMVFGVPIGYSQYITQNNWDLYIPNEYFYDGTSKEPLTAATGLKGTHISLAGDPTLRMYPGELPEPLSISVTGQDQNSAIIKWEVPEEDGIYYYNIYKSDYSNGPFTRINENIISNPEYIDNNAAGNSLYYLVKTLSLRETNTGTFYNTSKGVLGELITTGIEEAASSFHFSINPNPGNPENTTIYISSDKNIHITVSDINGRVNSNSTLPAGNHRLSALQFMRRDQKGIFIIQATSGTINRVLKYTSY